MWHIDDENLSNEDGERNETRTTLKATAPEERINELLLSQLASLLKQLQGWAEEELR